MSVFTSNLTIHSPALINDFAAALRHVVTVHDVMAVEPWAQGLLIDASRARASDIHLDPQEHGLRIRFRIDGVIHDAASLPLERGLRLIRYFKVHADLDSAPAREPQDGHIHMVLKDAPLDVRIACVPCVLGDKLTLRLHRRAPVKLRMGDLGLRDSDQALIHRWLGDISGMFVVSGPVGSGKTTTLYALLAELHLTDSNIVTIEDPVEYQLDRINQMEVNRQTGLTFDRALSAVLRHDPDYILLGEIRDRETAHAAMEAAAAGRVLLTTMHSRSAAGVITALRSVGILDFEIAASLAFVVSQRLVRRLCKNCRVQEAPAAREQSWLESLEVDVPDQAWHTKGCTQCDGSGYLGRVGLYEVVPIKETVYDLIIAGEDEHRLREEIQRTGNRSLLSDGLRKAAEGVTDYGELTRIGAQSYLYQRT